MKTTFRREFDKFDEFENINASILDEMEIDIDSIKNRVYAQTRKKPRKIKLSRRITIGLIAAAVGVGIIGTTAFASLGGIGAVFGSIFTGNMNAAGLYDGGEVEFTTTDKNLNVEFLGVTGDDNDVYAMMRAVRKDGSEFVDEGHTDSIYSPSGDNFDKFGCIVKGTTKDGSSLGVSGMGGGWDDRYYLSDDRKTLDIYVKVNVSGLEANGGRLTVISRRFHAQKMATKLAEYPTLDEKTYLSAEKLCRDKNIEEKNCSFVQRDGHYDYGIMDTKEYELPFELSFDMNYQNGNEIKLDITKENAPHLINDPDVVNGDYKATAFGISLYNECNWNGNFYDIDSSNSKVIMQDGTIYYLSDDGGSNSWSEGENNKVKQRLAYSHEPSPATIQEIVLVDTRKISEIIINGDTVYKK